MAAKHVRSPSWLCDESKTSTPSPIPSLQVSCHFNAQAGWLVPVNLLNFQLAFFLYWLQILGCIPKLKKKVILFGNTSTMCLNVNRTENSFRMLQEGPEPHVENLYISGHLLYYDDSGYLFNCGHSWNLGRFALYKNKNSSWYIVHGICLTEGENYMNTSVIHHRDNVYLNSPKIRFSWPLLEANVMDINGAVLQH